MSAQLELGGKPAWARDMNPEQMRAILHQDGPCKLLATAGSGKTRAVVHRIARMVEQGVNPKLVLAVTFSVKAAGEMNERLEQLGVDGARVGTWHSLCLQIIKDDGTRWKSWVIDDTHRAKALMKEVLGYKHLDWKESDLGEVMKFVGFCKAHLADQGTDAALRIAEKRFRPHEVQRAMDAYTIHQALLEERGLLTFDDMLVFTHRHLQDEHHRRSWAGRWSYLLVDEGQDNNPAQKALQELLARDHRNIMIVGDVGQAIYSFRGSSPEHLHRFEDDWPGCETIVMNRNYRSKPAIVEAANRIIAPAEVRLPADMIAERTKQGPGEVRAVCHDNVDDSGRAFVDWVYELLNSGNRLSSVCALFRTNAQSRALEEALLKRRVPYSMVGGTSFYNRKEVKDLLAYLRVAADRDDDGDAVRRCINAPFRYLGTAFVDRVQNGRGRDWVKRVEKAAEEAGIQQRQRESAAEWVNIVTEARRAIDEWDESPECARPSVILNDIVHKTRYVQWLEQDQGEETIEDSHAANVREMVRVSENFDTVDELLDYTEKMASMAERGQKGDDKVVLMSIHKSKGLEWPSVWVAGCNEGLLPHYKGDPEEERRLMYVAATRARDRLVLSYVAKNSMREGIRLMQPSRFLYDAGVLERPETSDADFDLGEV